MNDMGEKERESFIAFENLPFAFNLSPNSEDQDLEAVFICPSPCTLPS